MKRRSFIQNSLFTIGTIVSHEKLNFLMEKENSFRVRLLRHATLVLEVGGKRILVDPMLSNKEAMEPVANAGNNNRVPLVDLPVSERKLDALLRNIDAVLVTHTHRDHWDIAAQQKINKKELIFCQPSDMDTIKGHGFENVQKVTDGCMLDDISIYRTNGQHGTGEIGKKMGIVSGFIIVYKNHRLYITGDTIWCNDVRDVITKHHPTHIIANGGGARFVEGDPITMTTDDVIQLAWFAGVPVDVVHLETMNHCNQRRSDFKSAINAQLLSGQVNVPADGDWIV